MAPKSPNHLTADLLWSAALTRPEFAAGGKGPTAFWRKKVYPWLLNQQVDKIHRHASPEPWLTLNCTLQAFAGDGFHRTAQRFLGVQGGETTQREYEAIIAGKISKPLILVGGFPRTATTSVQAVVRRAFPTHVTEIPTAEKRFSLWDYAKHDVDVFSRISQSDSADVRLVITLRRFEDAIASLAVGRGSLECMNIELKIQRWNSWIQLASSPRVSTVPFDYLAHTAPAILAQALERILRIEADWKISPTDTYSSLMLLSGKGDVSNATQSNVPQPLRTPALESARERVIDLVGEGRIAEMARIYESVASSSRRTFESAEPT